MIEDELVDGREVLPDRRLRGSSGGPDASPIK
jgi:hypothetical protein